MLNVPSAYVKPLVQIVDWNIATYCDPENRLDDFRSRLKRAQSALEKTNNGCDAQIDDVCIYYIKEAIDNARLNVQECGVSGETVYKLRDWIMPIYANRKA